MRFGPSVSLPLIDCLSRRGNRYAKSERTSASGKKNGLFPGVDFRLSFLITPFGRKVEYFGGKGLIPRAFVPTCRLAPSAPSVSLPGFSGRSVQKLLGHPCKK